MRETPRMLPVDEEDRHHRVSVLAITTCGSVRYAASDALQTLGYGAFERLSDHPDTPSLWELATSAREEDRDRFVQLVRDHDPDLRSLADSLLQRGQLQPVRLRINAARHPDALPDYRIVFGLRRCLAILFNFGEGRLIETEPTVVATITTASLEKCTLDAMVENIHRKD